MFAIAFRAGAEILRVEASIQGVHKSAHINSRSLFRRNEISGVPIAGKVSFHTPRFLRRSISPELQSTGSDQDNISRSGAHLLQRQLFELDSFCALNGVVDSRQHKPGQAERSEKLNPLQEINDSTASALQCEKAA